MNRGLTFENWDYINYRHTHTHTHIIIIWLSNWHLRIDIKRLQRHIYTHTHISSSYDYRNFFFSFDIMWLQRHRHTHTHTSSSNDYSADFWVLTLHDYRDIDTHTRHCNTLQQHTHTQHTTTAWTLHDYRDIDTHTNDCNTLQQHTHTQHTMGWLRLVGSLKS